MSLKFKETSVKEQKLIKDNKTLSENVTTLSTEANITNEALIETWLSSMELTDAFMELAFNFFATQDKVAELEEKLAQVEKGGE